MFRAIGDRLSVWESRLPAELLRLPEELARVDALTARCGSAAADELNEALPANARGALRRAVNDLAA